MGGGELCCLTGSGATQSTKGCNIGKRVEKGGWAGKKGGWPRKEIDVLQSSRFKRCNSGGAS